MAVQIPFPLPSHGFALNSKMRVNLDFLVDIFNQFNTGTATWDQVSIGIANNEVGKLSFFNASNANYLTFQPGATDTNTTYTFPVSLPATYSRFLKSTTSGTMSWSVLSETSSYVGNKLLYADGNAIIQELDPGTGNKFLVNSTPPSFFSLLGTTNQITVTPNAGNFTLSTPQDIATTSAVSFNSVLVKGGTASNPSVIVNYGASATNTGIWASSGTQLDFTVAGTNQFAIDNSGFGVFVGGVTAPAIRATTSIALSTSTGRILTMQMPSSGGSDYTIVWPNAVGALGTVLTTDASGNLSWAVPSGTGANVSLSNLSGVSINADLVPSSSNAIDLGSSGIIWRTLYANRLKLGLAGTGGGQIQLNPNGVSKGALVIQVTDNSGNYLTTITNAAQGAARNYTIPDGGTDCNFVLDAGTFTMGGTYTFSNAIQAPSITLPATTNQLILGTTRTITITAPTPATSSRTWTIPDITENGTFAALEGTQTFSGDKTFTSRITTIVGSSDDTIYGSIRFNTSLSAAGVERYTTTGVTSTPKEIGRADFDSALKMVSGTDGTNKFIDIILTIDDGTVAPTVIGSYTKGSPAARTYSASVASVKVALASGTYTISVLAMGVNFR